MWLTFILIVLTAQAATADTVVASRTIRPQSILTLSDLALQPGDLPGGFDETDYVIGLETRVVLYAGRPIRPEDIGPPAVVERNQIVTLAYLQNGLTIRTEGRALSRAGVGEDLRVMNLQSRATFSGRVGPDGIVVVR